VRAPRKIRAKRKAFEGAGKEIGKIALSAGLAVCLIVLVLVLVIEKNVEDEDENEDEELRRNTTARLCQLNATDLRMR